MASSPQSFSSILVLLLASVVFSAAGFMARADEIKETHIHFYFHEISSGPNQSSYDVVIPNQNSTSLGDIRVFDNDLREGPQPESALIGRGQGTVAVVSDDYALLAQINFVFTAGEFNGSSLAMFGTILRHIDTPPTIVGGSGRFRLARGYVERKPVSSSATSYVVEFDIYVWHYN